jgi:16S rRNA (cytosine1402-N4)-methyltransferase
MASHESVLLKESITALAIKPNGVYIDGTFGRGGHSLEILNHLSAKGRLIAIDKDSEAINHAKEKFEKDSRFQMVQTTFAAIRDVANEKGVLGQVDGILLDLGVSSPQLDTASRGFSFLHDGPLDMRMDKEAGVDAATWINSASFDEMVYVFKTYGEERFAKRIARAIEKARIETPFKTTKQLAEVAKNANPNWEKHKHPATRIFQAIRIFINRELEDLELFLNDCLDVLAKGGRLCVISFHSLEDRMVKKFIKLQQQGPVIPKEIPIKQSDFKIKMKSIGKALKPSNEEVLNNPRARSAVLRGGEKVS